ncbi:hypothetical protein HYFRA_00001588 [Hymenoscyphus fraxineus]|uniref:Neprosin PEP catalytic domain-containing protein n=1 Tax=Hymenoscyphus fraxineus TaxID=746836 RepID=A0A9N9L7Y7_9HELO|nr:hypothetical protein HYFRA_00001588 [Hymenoscyphus fraxineus]
MPISHLKDFCVLIFFSIFLAVGISKPIGYSNSIRDQALRKRANLNVVKTTFTDTQTIDWIPLTSQGNIAQAPPDPAPRTVSRPLAELEQPGADLGPPGTVPIPQVNLNHLSNTIIKSSPEITNSKRQDSVSGSHWYVSSNQSVSNLGGSGIFSLFEAYTESPADFSLIQTAVTREDVSISWRGFPIPSTQTVEAGWINYKYQNSQPHLFTYYTTNGYIGEGDNQGGWNTEHVGWVQVDRKIHPGSVFTPLSVDGGAQNDLRIEYALFRGNWWLSVEDRWIGYYPGSLFSFPSSDPPENTLAGGSSKVHFYGEVLNMEESLTTTDMGSGQWASTGYGHAGYIINMTYRNTNNVKMPFNGSDFTDSDITRYTHEADFTSGTDRGSYMFLGGPGAGGAVNG